MKKRGLLIAPEFPSDTFWSYRYILKYLNGGAAFPPLGLVTFAALMPDDWDFELIDLNVRVPSQRDWRKLLRGADALFFSAMSIQKKSLIEILDGPVRGCDAPRVLGGPLASTYRDSIMHPTNASDELLHEGLDVVFWGEAQNAMGELLDALGERGIHKTGTPRLIIPQKVLDAPAGSRKYLNDRGIFKPLRDTPTPRWDLLDVGRYRALMMQTTAGCKFRCDFCDIIQFNGGFPRAKSPEQIKRELKAIYDTGHRGGLFVVDDNIMGVIDELSVILDAQIEFQREHDYPFQFFVQSSVDIAHDSNDALIEKFKLAGYNAMFFGIENPDPAALKAMNKKQNNRVDLRRLVNKFHSTGIEVFAGFIFGSDTDCTATADSIVKFVKDTSIFSAMTGMLTPLPHTPLFNKYRAEGRLIETEYTGNNTDDEIQFQPKNMTIDEMREGIHRILLELFNSKEIYRRALHSLEDLNPHIFAKMKVNPILLKAGAISFFKQGVKRLDRNYFELLYGALRLDARRFSDIRRQMKDMRERWRRFRETEYNPMDYLGMIDCAKEYLVRHKPDLPLSQVGETIEDWRARIQNRMITRRELEEIYGSALLYMKSKKKLFVFPGIHLVRAFELAIKGYHYEQVMRKIVVNP